MAHSTATVHPVFVSRRLKQTIVLSVKKYTPEVHNEAGVTLLFFHCAGSHKESWEPTIQSVFAADSSEPRSRRPAIREAWSFDMPSHGEAGTLNQQLLERIDEPLLVEDWAEGLQHFLASGTLKGHRLIAIGHSLGATAMFLAMLPGTPSPPAVYEAAIIVEPVLVPATLDKDTLERRDAWLLMTAKGVLKRRMTWNSRDEALAFFQERWPWTEWDPRVLKSYVRYGLRECKPGSAAVALRCSPEQESAVYLDKPPHDRIVDFFRSGMDRSLPVHWVTGGDITYVHQVVMSLRKVASWQEVPDADHFVVQEKPDELAAAICRIIEGQTPVAPAVRANL
ncbi:alpha/beta-hydrolase [Trametes gibbosa]|nr:alpha/beta-hydrolase [Trametes gibbosa]